MGQALIEWQANEDKRKRNRLTVGLNFSNFYLLQTFNLNVSGLLIHKPVVCADN